MLSSVNGEIMMMMIIIVVIIFVVTIVRGMVGSLVVVGLGGCRSRP